MTPPAWLLVAAAVLALVAGWCANAEAALALVSATGVAERPDHHGERGQYRAPVVAEPVDEGRRDQHGGEDFADGPDQEQHAQVAGQIGGLRPLAGR